MKFIFFILSGTSDTRGTKANLIMTVFQSPIKVLIFEYEFLLEEGDLKPEEDHYLNFRN